MLKMQIGNFQFPTAAGISFSTSSRQHDADADPLLQQTVSASSSPYTQALLPPARAAPV